MVLLLHTRKERSHLNIIWLIIVWIIALIVLVPLGFIILYVIGACLTYNHDSNQEKLAENQLRTSTSVALQLESYHRVLKQRFQVVQTKEFISHYNDSDEMMDSVINSWSQENDVVITDIKVFQTGKSSILTHFLVSYHKHLTTRDVNDTLEEYTEEATKSFMNNLQK